MKNYHSFYQKLTFIAVFLLYLMTPRLMSAQWEKLAQLEGTPSVVKFFSPTLGFIGNGGSPGSPHVSAHSIYRTTDAGYTWSPCTIPSTASGEITDFFMMDTSTGWVTVVDYPASSKTGLWKTVDGGKSWQSTSFSGSATSVHLTSKALIVTDLFSNNQISLDSGKTWHKLTDGGKNDLAFASDLFGVSSTYRGGSWRKTVDGGLTWTMINQPNEAWSLYLDKNTGTIMATPEGNSDGSTSNPSSLIVSNDSGRTWKIFPLPTPDDNTTGHIGVASDKIIFVQEQYGNAAPSAFYMTVDGGINWNAIGGGKAFGDTRFFVETCGTDGFVYAFDETDDPSIPATLNRFHFTLPVQSKLSSTSFSSSRIIDAKLRDTVHLPIYLNRIDAMGSTDLTVHYPIDGSLQYLNSVDYNGNSIDVQNSQWFGRAQLHVEAPVLNTAPSHVLGYANFSWSPLEFDCDKILFDSISIQSAAPCDEGKLVAMPFEGIIGSFQTCGISTVNENLFNLKFSIYPNPATITLTIDLMLDHGYYLQINVFDNLGRMIWGDTHQKFYETGEHKLHIDCHSFPATTVYARITNGTIVKTVKIDRQ